MTSIGDLIAFLSLTSAGTAGLALSIFLGWLFGRPKQVALMALALGPAGVVIAILHGSWAAVQLLREQYSQALNETGILPIIMVWLVSPYHDLRVWNVLFPLGVLVGAAHLFLMLDRDASPLYRLSREDHLPSPWSRLLMRLVPLAPLTLLNRIIIGSDLAAGTLVTLSVDQLKRHTVCVGRSGRGKTETVITIVAGCSAKHIPIVYIDGKNDPAIKARLRQIAAQNRVKFYAFDAMNPKDSSAYQFFAKKNFTVQTDMVVGLRKIWTQPHYKNGAHALSQISLKIHARCGIDIDLRMFKDNLSVNALLALLKRHAKQLDDFAELRNELFALRRHENDAIESIRPEVGNLTDAYFGELFDVALARRTHRQVLELGQARNECAIVYFGLPSLTYSETAAKLGDLVMLDLKATLPTAPSQWLLVFDEFSVFASRQVLNLVNMGRSFGASALLATQSFSDFDTEDSRQLLRQVLGSANSFFVHELTDPQDCELASQLFGTESAVEVTAQTDAGSPTGAGSLRGTYRFKVHPDELRDLAVGTALYLNKDDPTRIRKIRVRRVGS